MGYDFATTEAGQARNIIGARQAFTTLLPLDDRRQSICAGEHRVELAAAVV